MIEITFTHTKDGVEETFVNDARDIYVWESTDRQARGFVAMINEMGVPRTVDLYRLAHITAKRLELLPPRTSLDVYAAEWVLTVDLEEGAADVDPTQRDRSPTE